MGCAISSPLMSKKKSMRSYLTLKYGGSTEGGGLNDAVSLCRERKRLVKKAVKQRKAFAEGHFRYMKSLSSVSSAINVFVAKYSSSSPFSNYFIAFETTSSSQNTPVKEEGDVEERESVVCDHFYDEVECQWDFFNLLDNDEKKKKEKRENHREMCGKEEGGGGGEGKGRELLEALKDVEDCFLRVYEYGLELSRMLEVDKENASRKRSNSSRSSPCKSLLSPISRSTSSTLAECGGDRKSLLSCSSDTSSTWTESKIDSLDGHWGMISGSHSCTLGRLYAWEKKLYHEVKAGQQTHEIQRKIMREINSFGCPEHGKYSTDSQRLATLQLQSVIQDWYSCFSDYVSAQKAYVKSLVGWLLKFIDAEAEYHYTSSLSLPPSRFNGPALMVTCQRWSAFLEKLPDKSVKYAMKLLAKDIHALWVQQGVEKQQKRKVDGLDKEMDRKFLTYGKAEDKALVSKYREQRNVEEQAASLGEKKQQLEMFQKKVEMERERYHSSLQETERLTMNSIQVGFSSVFESLADFSRASAKVYADLVTLSHNAKV